MTETLEQYAADLQKFNKASDRVVPDELLAYAAGLLRHVRKDVAMPYDDWLKLSMRSIAAFAEALPSFLFAKHQASFFQETRTTDLMPANKALMDSLRTLPFPEGKMYPPYYQPFDEPEPVHDWDEAAQRVGRHFVDFDDYAKFIDDWKKEWKERKREYEKKQKQLKLTPMQQLTVGTPFFPVTEMLGTQMKTALPFSIPPHLRFAHEFVLGPSRSGKTTFLTAQISHDLGELDKGRCSVLVMDSHNELLPQLARVNSGFEVLYLEPAKYPIAMNIFDQGNLSAIPAEDRQDVYRQSMETIFFFINSITRTEITGTQETVLKFAIQAVSAIPHATVETLRQLLEPGGVAKFKHYFGWLHPTVREWIETNLPEKNKDYAASITAIRNRLAGFVADPLFRSMFQSTKNKLDLFELLQKPKLILVNTAGLGDATGPFGRFIIAKLEEVASKRRFVTEKLPIFAYIDEASDYIPDEPKVASMIDKIGKQKIGLIFATQREAHIRDLNVLDALRNVAIQCVTHWPTATITIDRQPLEVTVHRVNLSALPQRSEENFQKLRSDMRSRFAPAPESKPETPKPETNTNVRPDADDWEKG